MSSIKRQLEERMYGRHRRRTIVEKANFDSELVDVYKAIKPVAGKVSRGLANALRQAALSQLHKKGARFSAKRTTPRLHTTTASKVRSMYGVPYKITSMFARHGMFRALGVGRGRKYGSSDAERNELFWYADAIDAAREELVQGIPQHLEKAVGQQLTKIIQDQHGNVLGRDAQGRYIRKT